MKKIMKKSLSALIAFALAMTGISFKPATSAHALSVTYFVGGCILPICGGGSWLTGFLTLQEALSIAQSGDKIWVRFGTYYPDEGPGQTNNSASSTFTMKNGVEIYGGFAGTETLLSQRNISANTTILSGDIDKNDIVSVNGYTFLGNNANHVVTANGTNSAALLDGFFIQEGNADGAGGLNSVGGGIVNDAGSATFRNLKLYSNGALSGGGGMYNRGGSPTLTNVTFDHNKTSADGGGIYNMDGSSPTLNGGAITNNTAANGGGMYNNNTSNPIVTEIVFTSNTALDSGGGMYNYDHSNPVLTNVTFTSNTSNDSGGAGMYNQIQSKPSLFSVVFDSNHSVNGYGGGMMNNESSPSMNEVIFSNNSATFDGGGIYSFGNSTITHTGGSFTDNAAGGSGGGMYNDGINATLNTITFSNNTSNNDGGGMYNINSNPQLTNVNYTGNSAAFKGGGMVNFSSSPILTGTTFDSNTASWGAGMFNDNSNPTLTNATFLSNTASIQGGGISNEASSPILTNVNFTNNKAVTAAGMYNMGSFSIPVMTNITFSGNIASGNGGGMYNQFSAAPTIKNTTFSNNQAQLGGGIYNDSSNPTLTNVTINLNFAADGGGMYNNTNSIVTLINTIIANSTSGGDCVNNNGSSLHSTSSNNLIEDNADECSLVNGVKNNIVGQDPKLSILKNNGGLTQTHALQIGSPAIDAGTSIGCPAKDQRGLIRPQDGNATGGAQCDIGSYEAPLPTSTFADVAINHWAFAFIERLFGSGITGGCSTTPLHYCPDSFVTRAQMAIFLERGIHGQFFNPPNVTPTFTDTSGNFAEDWIEALKNDGITSGCGIGIYCPDSPVTRAQMAVFLLKAKHGASFVPPNINPTFGDTAGNFAEDWIEQLAAEGITSGCGGGNYCPESPVTRDQMAVFLVKAFNLP